MNRATPEERAALNELFAELCAIPSPSRRERAVADRCTAELERLGLTVTEDDAGGAIGGDTGNLVARIPGPPDQPTVLLCAHLDTVAHGDVAIEPVLEEDVWRNVNDAILGADNKAAVAVMLAAARRARAEPPPVGIELLLTVAEEDALAGAKELRREQLRADFGFVYDHATPIGEVVVATPTYYRLDAEFHGRAAHAGIRPEDGRSAIAAAAKAIARLRLGRLDDETTANVGNIEGGRPGTNIVPDRCRFSAETRSLDDRRAEAVVKEMVDHIQDAANDPVCDVDVDVDVARLFQGYRHQPDASQLLAAERALARAGYTATRIATGGASDANVLERIGLPTTNLANGTLDNHEPTERVSVAALEGMLDVTFALLEECAHR